MDPEYGIPGLGTYAAAGWGGSSQTEATYSPPSADATHAAELAIASARHVASHGADGLFRC